MEWELASIIAGERAAGMGLLSPPDEVYQDIQEVRRQSLLDREAIRRGRLPLRQGGYGIARAVDTGGAPHLGGKTLTLARTPTASSETNANGLLHDLPNEPSVDHGSRPRAQRGH